MKKCVVGLNPPRYGRRHLTAGEKEKKNLKRRQRVAQIHTKRREQSKIAAEGRGKVANHRRTSGERTLPNRGGQRGKGVLGAQNR